MRASTIFVIRDADEDNLITRRAQRLASLFNLTGARAALIASIAFEVKHG